jgi:hypothetical protein
MRFLADIGIRKRELFYGRVARARWRLVGTTLLSLAVVAGCANPRVSQGPSTTHPTANRHPGVPGPVYSAPKPCSSVVAPGTYSAAELMMTQDQVQQVTMGQYISLGLGASTVEVGLMAGREALAGRLATMFGAKVSITVGLTSYCGKPGRSPVCSSMPGGDPVPSGLILDLVVDHRTIKTGSFGNATLVVSEVGAGTFQMDTGQPLVAQIVQPGTRRVVGTYDAGVAGTGYGPKVGAGQDERIPVVFGTARCDGGLGSAMPTGRYDVIVYMHHEGPGPGPVYYSPAVPVVVTGSS